MKLNIEDKLGNIKKTQINCTASILVTQLLDVASTLGEINEDFLTQPYFSLLGLGLLHLFYTYFRARTF